MARHAALPFVVKRTAEVFDSEGYTSTKETVHGLLILKGDRLVIQSRMARKTATFGTEMRSDEEMDPVREVVIPLTGVAGSFIRGGRWSPRGPRLILLASDLRAFEEVVGAGGPSLGHPGELVLPVRRGDVLLAQEFSAELALAVAELGSRGLDRTAAGWPSRALEGSPHPEKKSQ